VTSFVSFETPPTRQARQAQPPWAVRSAAAVEPAERPEPAAPGHRHRRAHVPAARSLRVGHATARGRPDRAVLAAVETWSGPSAARAHW